MIDFKCGDADVHVLLSQGGGNKSWSVDDARSTDGTTFHVKVFEIRVYQGTLTKEPDGVDPLFVGSRSFGQRVGQGATTVCDGHRPLGPNATGFITVDATVRS